MSKKVTLHNFKTHYIIGTYNGLPACSVLPMDDDYEVSPLLICGMMTALLDAVIETLPENIQSSFEEKTLDIFTDMFKERYEHVSKFKLED